MKTETGNQSSKPRLEQESGPGQLSLSLSDPLQIRWLGKTAYRDAWALQKSLFGGKRGGKRNYLLLMEHFPVYTFGVRGKQEHLQKNSAALGAESYWVDRGGDVTFHGPGQLVGYPVLSLPLKKSGLTDTAAYVFQLEELLIQTLRHFGISGALRKRGFPGIWAGEKKIASVGVRLTRGRTMHGFGLNVNNDLSWFDHIVPCGISGIQMTSMKKEGADVLPEQVAEAVADLAAANWASAGTERTGLEAQDSVQASPVQIQGLELKARKPEWLRAPVVYSNQYQNLKKTLSGLTTVCEEAGCPNIYECWGAGTATFMINGDRCTRNCGFCLVDTRKPLEVDSQEPERLALAVKEMGLSHVVVTAVARDDLADGGAEGFLRSIRAIRRECPEADVEVLIPDFKGDPELLDSVFSERPDILNHNLETVLRLQKKVRPQAGYVRSLAVLARAKEAGLITKSSLMAGLGETQAEMQAALLDLASVGTDIVTIGQYLRPSQKHLPVARWVEPQEFQEMKAWGEDLGISHVESGPLVRSSYLAGEVSSEIKGRI